MRIVPFSVGAGLEAMRLAINRRRAKARVPGRRGIETLARKLIG